VKGRKQTADGRRQDERRASFLPPAPASCLLSFRVLFFGGKGGVGKTTAACSTALHLLETAASSEQLLLFSTDPAHSLSDSLEVKIGDRLTEVARHKRARLFAFEMDAAAALEKFKSKHHRVLAEIAERGTLLDESDINELLNLSLPGMDEVMALFELGELDASGEYTRLIIDTAPSGHTARLLRLPEVFSHMIRALDRMSDKHRYIIAQFARGAQASRADEVDLFLRDLNERIERVRMMLYDGERTSFTLVTIPEAMAVEETARYFTLLKDEGVPVGDLIINRVEQEHDDCHYCHARVVSQKPWLKRIAREFKPLRLHHVPLLAAEVRGIEALRRFGSLVWQKERQEADGRRQTAGKTEGRRQKAGGRKRETPFVLPVSCSCLLPPDNTRLLLFGGKGGVGKTTAAAAAALALAEDDESSRVLIFSTDPAHSLSDSFDERIGEFKQGVGGRKNLDAMEIDPARRFDELKSRYRAWIDELFETLSGNSRFEIQFEREAMREIVQLAPPGIDEIAALSAISDLVDQNRYSTIVLDTAPTGHLIRFLELPGVALSWVRTFIKLLLKYKAVVRSSGVAEELVALSKSIKRMIALLTDSESCEFVGVAIPERMSLDETLRLTETIERLKVPMRRLLINSVVPERAAAHCDFCRARWGAQDELLKEFARRFKGRYELFVAPQQPHEIHGMERLREHFAAWQRLDQTARNISRTARKRKGASQTAGRR
jgi:arsenite-transporting ATPase